MAKVSFSALIEEITGKLAGSVFQDSYQGFQIRSRVSPRNPRSQLQQLRRGEFGFLTQQWRKLSPSDRNTWIANAPPGMQGINFFVQSNVNLILIGQDAISSTTPGLVPDSFPIEVSTLEPPDFEIAAVGTITAVPSGHALLVFATQERPPSQLFDNPSMFQPIVVFAAFSDLGAGAPIGVNWRQHYGIMRSGFRICVKACLINAATGLRGPESIACATEGAPVSNLLVDSDGTFITDQDGTFITYL